MNKQTSGNTAKLALGHTLNDLDDHMPVSISDCEAYGMMGGCDPDCPVWDRGECEIQESNKEDFKTRGLL